MPLQMPNGQIAGVLDISGPAHFPHPHTLNRVKAAAKQIEYLWVKQSLHPQQWLLSLHPQPQGIDTSDELLLVFSDNVLTAANRLAMRELALSADRFASLTFQQLFPQLQQQANSVPAAVDIGTQRYWFRLRAPQRSHVSVPDSRTHDLPRVLGADGAKCFACWMPAFRCAFMVKPAAARSMSARAAPAKPLAHGQVCRHQLCRHPRSTD